MNAARLLVAAAALHLVIQLLAFGGQPWHIEVGVVIASLRSAISFALAAAVLIGLVNWPAGGSWLLAGAAALAVRGTLDLAGDAWIWWLYRSPEEAVREAGSWFPYARGIASMKAAAVAPVLLSVGLWRGTTSSAPLGRVRRPMLAGIALVGGLALAAEVWLIALLLTRTSMPLLNGILYGLVAVELAAMALLAAVSLRSIGNRAPLPEALIAGGATLVVASAAWSAWVSGAYPLSEMPPALIGWAYIVPNAIGLLGVAAVAIGFVSGRLVPDAARLPLPLER